MSKDVEQKLNQLQLIEQNLQQLLSQKQQFQMQQMEIESALSELEKTPQAYKIIGSIMVASSTQDLTKELKEKNDVVNVRIKTIEKQEEKLREKAGSYRKEVLEQMKGEQSVK